MAHDMGVNWLEFAVNSGSSDVFTLATVGQDSLVKLWKIYLGKHLGFYRFSLIHRMCYLQIR